MFAIELRPFTSRGEGGGWPRSLPARSSRPRRYLARRRRLLAAAATHHGHDAGPDQLLNAEALQQTDEGVDLLRISGDLDHHRTQRHVDDARAVDVHELHDLGPSRRLAGDLDERQLAHDGLILREVRDLPDLDDLV